VHLGNVPANFNRALKEASGDFVVIMSLDDLLMPGCIDNAIQVLSKNKDIVFFANSGHYEIDENGERLTPNVHLPGTGVKILSANDLLENEYNMLGVFYIQGQVFRKNILEKVGFFDEDMTGDDIVLRTKIFLLMLDNPQMQFVLGSDVVLAYRKHCGNLHKKTFRQIKTVIEWKERYFPTRPYPSLFYRWLDHFFIQSVRSGALGELAEARLYSVVIESRFEELKGTWKYKRNLLKQRIRNWITSGY
jgi:alpha-1,3-rhamnosyltransferase